MVFRQGKRLKWAQYSLLVNGVKRSDGADVSPMLTGTNGEAKPE